jgi:NAD+ kinase
VKKTKILINMAKPYAKNIRSRTENLLREHGFQISKKPDFVIAIGGDGWMIHTAHIYYKQRIPILGVNAGGLGFLTNITLNELGKTLQEIKKKKYVLENRMMIQARLKKQTLVALNDLTIVTRIPGRAVEFSAEINKEYMCRMIADGIIIATPTGSTAYSLASGGPILLPHTEGIIVTAVAPHTLSVRPLVLPSDSTIKITIGEKGKAMLVADGQHSKNLINGQEIILNKSRYKTKLLKPMHITFFNTLRGKMQWGGRENA